jgi:type I restriction enzyme, S subunit
MSEGTKKSLVPVLRFPEFRDAGEWEAKSLNHITTAIFDGTHQTPTYTEDGVPFFSVENIVSGKLNKFISREDYLAATSKNKPEKGDVLITRIGNIGFSTVVDWDYEFSIYVTLAVVKMDDRFNSLYLHSFMQSGLYQTEIRSKSLLNAVPCKINMDELRRTKVLLPAPKEQQKIADCLSSIDELVTAQTQKVEALKAHKKGLMQQIFPAEGETVPKLRFPEFRDAGNWQVKKIGQVLIVDARPIKMNDEQDYSLVTVKRRYGGVVSRGTFKGGSIKVKSQFLLEENDFLISKRQIVHCACGLVPAEFEGSIVSNEYSVLRARKNNDIVFFNYFAQQPKVSQSFLECSIGIVIEKMLFKLNDWLKQEFLFPSFEEQQKIANCLSSIDELITAQTQKLAALKAHKKGLMQRLFPAMDDDMDATTKGWSMDSVRATQDAKAEVQP